MQRNSKMWPYSRKKADNKNGFSIGPVLGLAKSSEPLLQIRSKNYKKKKWQQKIGDFNDEKPNGNSKIEK